MNKLSFFFICLFLSALSAGVLANPTLRAPAAAAQPHVSTTPEQRKRVIEITQTLETAPFGERAGEDREWALSLIDHAPDIFPSIHGPIIFDITENSVPDRRAIYAQFVFGFVSFQLANPDRADDPIAAYHAGFSSCLRVYRTALHRDPANRISFLDSINEQERGGTLPKHVERLVTTLLPENRAK